MAASTDTDSSCSAAAESDTAVQMVLVIEDFETASELLRSLTGDRYGESVYIDHLSGPNAGSCVLTVDHISEKRLEAVRKAIEAGYYERPRAVSLSELAATFDISSSAMSQRLTAVEHTLIRALYEQGLTSAHD
ncbi:helix-turn-helix domain-containing protein [Halobacteria archaeon AArc-curdl1]|uniref:Helix-turn-helix domain-containing protein n=1 Tax=Natronosalvus hydrolyticus TaxID=2979988 RepID=A0AAP3E706_9EURY|nr:helix-turn-helix domain-containing protein [Halobacteria archaeon AArc-curdl1]